jgi:hypothetical protein
MPLILYLAPHRSVRVCGRTCASQDHGFPFGTLFVVLVNTAAEAPAPTAADWIRHDSQAWVERGIALLWFGESLPPLCYRTSVTALTWAALRGYGVQWVESGPNAPSYVKLEPDEEGLLTRLLGYGLGQTVPIGSLVYMMEGLCVTHGGWGSGSVAMTLGKLGRAGVVKICDGDHVHADPGSLGIAVQRRRSSRARRPPARYTD